MKRCLAMSNTAERVSGMKIGQCSVNLPMQRHVVLNKGTRMVVPEVKMKWIKSEWEVIKWRHYM